MRRIFLFMLTLVMTCTGLLAQETSTDEPAIPTGDVSVTAEVTAEPTAEPTAPVELAKGVNYPDPGSYTVQEKFELGTRQFRIYIPGGYPDAEARGESVPLVMVLHGAGGNGTWIEGVTSFDLVAERETFIVVYPDGINGGWGDGRSFFDPNDDVSYLTHVMDFVSGQFEIDPARIYSTGYSMGGMMSFRLGCLLPDRIAAVASVASTFPRYQRAECDEAPPVPVMMVLGTNDSVIPWNGEHISYLSALASVEYWAEHNECAQGPNVTEEFDVDPDDSIKARRETFNQCADDTEVTLYGVVGGDHTWPGHPFSVGEPEITGTSMDFDATVAIWNFFQRHTSAGSPADAEATMEATAEETEEPAESE